MDSGIVQSIVSGIISGIIASICFTIFLLMLKPRLKVSNQICFTKSQSQDNILTYKIKVVNKSLAMITNIRYSLYYLEMYDDKMSRVTEIKARNVPILAIDGFSRSHRKEKTHYAINISFNIDSNKYPINNNSRFEFVFMGNHSISNTTVHIKKQYYSYDIVPGTFENDDSVNVRYIGI